MQDGTDHAGLHGFICHEYNYKSKASQLARPWNASINLSSTLNFGIIIKLNVKHNPGVTCRKGFGISKVALRTVGGLTFWPVG